MSIRVYGLPDLTNPTISELRILIGGLAKYQKGKVLTYRFRHSGEGDRYRAFSYAFLVSTDVYVYWVFFPSLGGLDSGGALRDFKMAESLISRLAHRRKVERKYFDISYQKLEDFLQRHAEGFNVAYKYDDEREDHVPPSFTEGFGGDFAGSYAKFEERYRKNEYPQALRDLRALVQEALEIVCEKKAGPVEKDSSIPKLSGLLIGKSVIDERLQSWFQAFSSIANQSAHRGFPSKKDLDDSILAGRIMLTFGLGRQLVFELGKTLESAKKLPAKMDLAEDGDDDPIFPARQRKTRVKQLHETSIGLPPSTRLEV